MSKIGESGRANGGAHPRPGGAATAKAGAATAKSRERPRVRASQVLGEVLVIIGALILSFAFYEAYWTNLESGRRQEAAAEKLDQSWDEQRINPRGHLTPDLGEAFARMYIPAFGSDFHFAIIEGTQDEDLLAGPGRYVDSQMPGEPGNFAVAGHRVGKGAPFNDLDELNTCDAIVVETSTSWDVYRVMPMAGDAAGRRAEAAPCFSEAQVQRMAGGDYSRVPGRQITTPDHIEVIHPIPDQADTAATPDMEPLLTLTTCHPQFSNAERMIIHAMQVESIQKSGNTRPAVLEES